MGVTINKKLTTTEPPMLSYNSVKWIICHNSDLESISKFFRLVINGVYIDGSVLVASLVGKTSQLLREAKGCRRYMGQDMSKGYLMVMSIKNLVYAVSVKYYLSRAFT